MSVPVANKIMFILALYVGAGYADSITGHITTHIFYPYIFLDEPYGTSDLISGGFLAAVSVALTIGAIPLAGLYVAEWYRRNYGLFELDLAGIGVFAFAWCYFTFANIFRETLGIRHDTVASLAVSLILAAITRRISEHCSRQGGEVH